jgi:formylglycine-generating enzyme required for sulfatase activity
VRSFRSPSPGLAPVNAPSGTYIAFATAPGTTASDGDGANGLYTQELLANLKQPGLRLEDIFIRTRVSVKKKSNDVQVPWENGALEGVIVLNGKGGSDPTTLEPSPPSTTSAAPTAAAFTKAPVISYSGIPLSTLRSEKFTTASVDEKGQVTKREAGPASYYTEDLGNGVKLEMVYIRGGGFQMGSPRGEAERDEEEIQHQVKVSSFWMGRYEVTQAQWLAVMGRLPYQLGINEAMPKGDDLPITCASWVEVQKFIANLNELLKLKKGKGYCLPREAEWEYASRAGTTTPFPFGATITPELANYSWETSYANGPTRDREQKYANIMKVGSFPANALGLYDMVGNVSEYCEDWLGEYPPPGKGEQIDPTGATEGERRVVRGCEYGDSAKSCRSARRVGYIPDTDRYADSVGFRLVRR